MIAVLCGGGIDTIISMTHCKINNLEALPIYYKLGHNYSEFELKTLLKLYPNIIIDESLRELGKLEDSAHYIPHRNIHLIMSAFRYSASVMIGSTVDDVVNDQNRKAFNILEQLAMEIGIKNAKIITPFLNENLGKIEATQMYKDYEGFKDNIINSFSCFEPIHGHECLGCSACFRKNVVLAYVFNNNRPFTNKPMAMQYLHKAKHTRVYGSMRSLAIIEYMERVYGEK